MSTVHTEHVLVIPTELLHEVGYFQGFCGDVERYLGTLLDTNYTRYRPRSDMEQDPSFKQLIPYVVFRYAPASGPVQLFQYRRGTGQGESRLHSRRSVGIGGHISSDDAAADNVYRTGMHRELDEEVVVETQVTESCVGLINDDETEVGRVHLGVVHVFDVAQPLVRPREDEILEAGFQPLDDLMNDLESFETWSQICLKHLF